MYYTSAMLNSRTKEGLFKNVVKIFFSRLRNFCFAVYFYIFVKFSGLFLPATLTRTREVYPHPRPLPATLGILCSVGRALGRDPFNQNSGNFGLKPNGSARSNRKSFEKTGPPFEVDHFSRSDRLELWLNGSRPLTEELEVAGSIPKVMSPDILSHVARNFRMLKKILKMRVH